MQKGAPNAPSLKPGCTVQPRVVLFSSEPRDKLWFCGFLSGICLGIKYESALQIQPPTDGLTFYASLLTFSRLGLAEVQTFPELAHLVIGLEGVSHQVRDINKIGPIRGADYPLHKM